MHWKGATKIILDQFFSWIHFNSICGLTSKTVCPSFSISNSWRPLKLLWDACFFTSFYIRVNVLDFSIHINIYFLAKKWLEESNRRNGNTNIVVYNFCSLFDWGVRDSHQGRGSSQLSKTWEWSYSFSHCWYQGMLHTG